jgi:hypothetical protein
MADLEFAWRELYPYLRLLIPHASGFLKSPEIYETTCIKGSDDIFCEMLDRCARGHMICYVVALRVAYRTCFQLAMLVILELGSPKLNSLLQWSAVFLPRLLYLLVLFCLFVLTAIR